MLHKIILFLLCVICCCPLYGQPQKIELRLLEGYYANDQLKLHKGVNYLVFSKANEFERYFGKIEKEGKPNFDYEHVVAILTPPTREQYFLSFNPIAFKAGSFIEIYCQIRKEKHLITYLDRPIALAAIPKYFAVKSIHFYRDKNKKPLKKIPVSAR